MEKTKRCLESECHSDVAFRAVGEATEEAVLNSLVTAEAVFGRDGNTRPALKDLMEKYHLSFY